MGSIERKKQSNLGLVLGLGSVAVGAAIFGGLLVQAQQLPQGVQPISWDKESCANCRMHVGERGFAAQLQLVDGRVLNFDDPGCLFQHQQRPDSAAMHAVFFHHLREERWLTPDEVGFVSVSPTPMGFGLGAVNKSEAGTISLEAARAQVLRPHDGGAPGAAR